MADYTGPSQAQRPTTTPSAAGMLEPFTVARWTSAESPHVRAHRRVRSVRRSARAGAERASASPCRRLSRIGGARRRACPAPLVVSALVLLLGCVPPPAAPATVAPTATVRSLPSSTAPPPPRPTAAPPALSPASSPIAVASPRTLVAGPRQPLRLRAAQLGALS